MFTDIIYKPLFLTIVVLMTLIVVGPYNNKRWAGSGYAIVSRESTVALFFMIFMVLFIGTRPASYLFVDMRSYLNDIEGARGYSFKFNTDTDNLVFDNIVQFWGTSGLPTTLFYTMMALGYFGLAFFTCRKLFPRDTLISFLVFCGAFSTFSYGTNGIKAGLAASMFLPALAYYDKRKIAVIIALVTVGFHHSMIVPAAALICSYFYRKSKWYFVFWCACVLISAAHVTFFQQLFAGLADERTSNLYLNTNDYGTIKGFRPDFIAYSAMPIVAFYFCFFKRGVRSEMYSGLINTYMLANGVWMLCMYAEFTNRIAYLSWFMYPIVLIYPFLREDVDPKQYKYFFWIVLGHLLFIVITYFTGQYQ